MSYNASIVLCKAQKLEMIDITFLIVYCMNVIVIETEVLLYYISYTYYTVTLSFISNTIL